MKTLFLIILVIVPQLGASEESTEIKVGEAFAKGYAKSQMMARTGEFLNQNPKLVFSADPKIGTKVFSFATRTMSVIGFLQAKTDKERAWAATSFILSPEPTTAMILLAVQLADAMISVGHMRDLARIYNRAIAFARQRTVIEGAISESESIQIDFHCNEISSLMNEIVALKMKLQSGSDLIGINVGDLQQDQIDETSTKEILTSIFSFETSTRRLAYLESNLKILVSDNRHAFEIELGHFMKEVSEFLKEIEPTRIHSMNIKKTYIALVSILESESVYGEIKQVHLKKSMKTKIQLYCFELINDNFKPQRRDEIEEIFANCVREYSIL